jgi:50S ribosomal protein L16 3-hydroxylase
MLYLPPRYAHDGIAEGECMTYSIGFRAPGAAEVAQEVLQRLAEGVAEEGAGALYRDPTQAAVERSAEIPHALEVFARNALEEALKDPLALARVLGEHLSEPKANVWFEDQEDVRLQGAIRLDRRTRMLYDTHHVFINGEGFRASGRDAKLMRQLADARMLDAKSVGLLSGPAGDLVQEWMEAGWLHDES